MISKKKIALSLASVSAMVMLGGTSLSAVSASAEDPDAGLCTVTGAVTSSGITNAVPPAATGSFGFTSVSINCISAGDDNGAWTVNVVPGTGKTTLENCAASATIAADLTGSGPEGALTGKLDATASKRVGASVTVKGTINAAGETHTFVGHLIFVPSNGECSPGGTGPTTAAQIATGSTAVVSEGVL